MTTLLEDSFAHHVWATERILDACSALTPEQLTTPAPSTYGPIIATLWHLGRSDAWYLSFFRADGIAPINEEDVSLAIAALRSAMASNGALWMEVLASDLDADRDLVEHGEGWDFQAPTGLRLAQVIQHGTDHRSQVCTAPLSRLTTWGTTDQPSRSQHARAPGDSPQVCRYVRVLRNAVGERRTGQLRPCPQRRPLPRVPGCPRFGAAAAC